MKKRTITLEDGTVVDCGVKEFDAMLEAVEKGDTKAVVGANVKVLLSSEALMNKLVKGLTEGFKLVGELHRLEEIAKIRRLRKAERKRLEFLRNKLLNEE